MKALLFLPFLFLGLTPSAAQEVAKTTSPLELSRWSVRVYPLAAITNLRAEVGHRFSNGLEVNVLGAWYYRKIFWYRGYKEALPFPYYLPADGAQVYLSLEKQLKNEYLFIGGRIGYREVLGHPRSIYSFDSYETFSIQLNQIDALCIIRFRSRQKGFFIEYTAQAGLRYTVRNESIERTLGDPTVYYRNSSDAYWFPTAALGINLGFGW